MINYYWRYHMSYIAELLESNIENFDSVLDKLLDTDDTVDLGMIYLQLAEKLIEFNCLIEDISYYRHITDNIITDLEITESIDLIRNLAHKLTDYKKALLICPICMTILKKVNYEGYYDKFSFYQCNCKSFVDGVSLTGGFV